jgi:ribokinase
MFDLISIGDCVIDTVIPLESASIIKNEGATLLGLRYGSKVPVGSAISMVGGNAANNAVGSARLKLKTAIYTNVGNKDDDEADDRIKAKFKKEGVDTRYVSETADLPSNHNIILEYNGDRTILIHHQMWKFNLPDLDRSKWIYLTSMSPSYMIHHQMWKFNLPDLDRSKWIYLTSMSPSYIESNVIEQLINYTERTGAKLAYQPGTFQIKEGAKKQSRLLSLVEVLILNIQETKLFLNLDPDKSVPVKKLLQELAHLGPRKIVITDGGQGSYGFDGERFFKLGIFPAKLVEMTGAGDAFATGTVAGLIHGESLDSAMRWGAANSAGVVEEMGPQAGLLSLHQMEEKLKENKKIIAQEI